MSTNPNNPFGGNKGTTPNLFGNQNTQQAPSLFGNNNSNQPTGQQQQQGGNIFSNAANQPTGTGNAGLFGGGSNTTSSGPGIFGNANKPA